MRIPGDFSMRRPSDRMGPEGVAEGRGGGGYVRPVFPLWALFSLSPLVRIELIRTIRR